MRTRTTTTVALLASAFLALPLSSSGSTRSSARRQTVARPNIVFIVSDDERVAGNTVMRNVNRLLARHGVTFDNMRVATSECGPSRASILTGQYSHHTGVLDNFGPHSYPAFDAQNTLPIWLHRAGYTTALVGKYLNDYTLDGHHVIPPGWDDWQAIDSVPEERYYDYSLNENGRHVHFGNKPSDYSTTVLASKALSFLRSARKPFFLYFAPVAPHLPAVPAPEDVGRFDKLAPFHSPSLDERNVSDKPWAAWHDRALTTSGLTYVNEVRRHQLESLQAVDRSVARIVGMLARRHLLDNTVIFYTSDNGFLWGEHRLGGKLWPYEESTRVPLVVRTPWDSTGTVDHHPILNIDFASTISALARVTPGAPQDGDSFVPLLHHDPITWRRDYLIEYLGKNKLSDSGPPPYVAVHTPDFLYVKYHFHHWQELYDLRRDPWELRNVVDDPAYASALTALRAELRHLYARPPHPAREVDALS